MRAPARAATPPTARPRTRSHPADPRGAGAGAALGLSGPATLAPLQRAVGNRRMGALVRDARAAAPRPGGRAVRALARQSVAVAVPEVVVHGCTCERGTRTAYRAETFTYIRGLRPLLDSIVPARDRLAVAGAIADEFDTRQGARTVVDAVQDWVIGSLSEEAIATDRHYDIHSKFLNALENDIGPANIKVRTALELVERGDLVVPGSPRDDVKVAKIIEYLLTDRGTVAAAAAVIARAHRHFDAVLPDLGDESAQAVLVEYFKQGERYPARFAARRAADPGHLPCPGEGGCRFWHNADRLRTEIGLPAAP